MHDQLNMNVGFSYTILKSFQLHHAQKIWSWLRLFYILKFILVFIKIDIKLNKIKVNIMEISIMQIPIYEDSTGTF